MEICSFASSCPMYSFRNLGRRLKSFLMSSSRMEEVMMRSSSFIYPPYRASFRRALVISSSTFPASSTAGTAWEAVSPS